MAYEEFITRFYNRLIKNKIATRINRPIAYSCILLLLFGNNALGQITLICPTNITISCTSNIPQAAYDYNSFNALPGASVSSGCGGLIAITHQDVITNQTAQTVIPSHVLTQPRIIVEVSQ